MWQVSRLSLTRPIRCTLLHRPSGRTVIAGSRAIDRIERKVDALTELVGVFVQHHLSSTAHQPDIGREAANLGLRDSTSCSILSSSVSPKAAALHA